MRSSVGIAELSQVRLKWLSAFQLEYEGHLPGKLKEVLDDNTEEDFWLHETETCDSLPAGDALEQLFSAYRLLRFEHQLQYASYKVRDEGMSSLRQVSLLRDASMICILVVFIVHFIIALSLVNDWLMFARSAWAHVLVVWTTIIALGARALEEGLQPTKEVERYTRTRSGLARLLYHFDHALDPTEKIQIMRETERVVYQEMRAFLKTNDATHYVL
jgi:hypothetical protein